LEEAMARHAKREWWAAPFVYTAIAVVLVGVLAGALAVVLLEQKSITTRVPGEDPRGKILNGLVRELDSQIPPGAQVLSHRYEEPRWHNCSAGRSAGYSGVQAEIVFRSSTIPKVVGSSALQLANAERPLTWSASEADVTVDYVQIPGTDAWIWTYDANTGFDAAQDFCGGPPVSTYRTSSRAARADVTDIRLTADGLRKLAGARSTSR